MQDFADRQVRTNIMDGARARLAEDKAAGRRLVLATASYRLYADAIAERLGFDDVIGTGSIIGLDERVHAKIEGDNCYGPAKLRMIADWVEKSGLRGRHGHVRFYSDHVSDRPAFECLVASGEMLEHAEFAGNADVGREVEVVEDLPVAVPAVKPGVVDRGLVRRPRQPGSHRPGPGAGHRRGHLRPTP